MKIRTVVVVDDHPIILEGLARTISAEPDLEVIGMAGDVSAGLLLVDSTLPDLVVTDLCLPGRNGLELIAQMESSHPEIPVIVVSAHDERIYAERVLRAGGRAYVMKDAPPGRIVEAIRAVLDGGVFASRTVSDRVVRSLTSGKRASAVGCSLERLTKREIQVLGLIGQAKPHQMIAEELGISVRTLDAHRNHIRLKLRLADASELARHAIRWVETGGC